MTQTNLSPPSPTGDTLRRFAPMKKQSLSLLPTAIRRRRIAFLCISQARFQKCLLWAVAPRCKRPFRSFPPCYPLHKGGFLPVSVHLLLPPQSLFAPKALLNSRAARVVACTSGIGIQRLMSDGLPAFARICVNRLSQTTEARIGRVQSL